VLLHLNKDDGHKENVSYYWDDDIKEDEMSVASDPDGRGDECTEGFEGETLRETSWKTWV
jgi:hypothetical protein